MPDPRAGDAVRVTLKNGETVEGVIEWVDGNGALVRGSQKARWVPLEALVAPPVAEAAKAGKSVEE